MDFATWLQSWLRRHPLKDPQTIDRSRYTAEVMARVKADAAHPVGAWWLPWPRVALAVATATAGTLIALTILRLSQPPVALVDEVTQDTELLAQLEEGTADLLIENGDTLDQAFETTDALMLLAESSPAESNEQWLEETMQLLDQLDEGVSSNSDQGSEEDWLDELQLLDETDLAAGS